MAPESKRTDRARQFALASCGEYGRHACRSIPDRRRRRTRLITAVAFDGEEAEAFSDWRTRLGKLNDSSLLWIDLDAPEAADAAELRDAFALAPESVGRLETTVGGAFFKDFGSYLHLTALAPRPTDGPEITDISTIECLVGENWIVTSHDRPAEVLEEFAELAGGSGDVGQLRGPMFLATIIEWVLYEYARAFETIETQLEAFDVDATKSTKMDARSRHCSPGRDTARCRVTTAFLDDPWAVARVARAP